MRGERDWIQTYCGGFCFPLDPRPEEIEITDIAHALSLKCRFSGHTKTLMSVAQHSILVAQHVPPHEFWGLMHDSSEAYLPDVPRPLKHHLWIKCDDGEFRPFSEIEGRLLRCIGDKYGLSQSIPEAVHEADVASLATERRDVLKKGRRPWGAWQEVTGEWPEQIVPWAPRVAEDRFLAFFNLFCKEEHIT